MDRFFLVDLVPFSAGDRGPDLPENEGFLELAADPEGGFGIYGAYLNSASRYRSHPGQLEPSLERLVSSALRFPPALALARRETEARFREGAQGKAVFSDFFFKRVLENLRKQGDGKYLLAEAVCDQVGFFSKGSWYWIVSASQGTPRYVYWVSAEFSIYKDLATNFSLDDSQIKALSGVIDW